MPLSAGERLGPYEILSPLGAGGMGEVYKARDTRLGRDVALKVSKSEFTARFEREARTVAALSHPHICTLYDVGPNYLVMELIDGVPLKGPLPVDKAVEYAAQILDALDAAHRKGITHRDLKPPNILVTRQGIKLLDFGLAKQALSLNEDTPTVTALSVEGKIAGTPQYMAPEQLQGKESDARGDIFSFGCVLYEMLGGARAFVGSSAASVIAAILEREPEPLKTAPLLDRVIRRCLAKDPDERFQTARDLKAAMLWAMEGTPSTAAPARAKTPWVVAAALFGLLAAVLGFVHFRQVPSLVPTIAATISLPENTALGSLALSLSPEGSRLVLALPGDVPRLFIRRLDSQTLQPLSNTEGARNPFWSPDGKFIGFFADGKLKTIPAIGGIPQNLCDATRGAGGTWSHDGVILFSEETPNPIFRTNAAGGTCTPVTKAETATSHRVPVFLPDGNHFLYAAGTLGDPSKTGVYLASLDDPNGRRLLADFSGVIHTPPPPGGRYSHLLFLRETTLMAQPFDDRSLKLAGDPFPVAAQALFGGTMGKVAATASANGILAYVAMRPSTGQLLWLDRAGKELGAVGAKRDPIEMALSPDEKTVADAPAIPGYSPSMWLHNLARDSESRFAERGGSPVWSPEGNHIIYWDGNDLYLREVATAGPAVLVLRSANPKYPSDWSPDGRFLLYTEEDPKTHGDIWYVADPRRNAGGARPVQYLATNAVESQAHFSPDGRWVAYSSDQAGGLDIYVRPFPSGQGESRVSTKGGSDPRWSKDGREIYYLERGGGPYKLMAAAVRAGREGRLEFGIPRKLFEKSTRLYVSTYNYSIYSPAADGRFLMFVLNDTTPPALNLITNWWKLAGPEKAW